jgi:hypothetical protein
MVTDRTFSFAVCLQEGSSRQPAKSAREVCQDRRMRPAETKRLDGGKNMKGIQSRASFMELWLLEASRRSAFCDGGGEAPRSPSEFI